MAFPGDYTKYQEVTIDSSKIPTTQSNFPVYVDLSDMVKAGDDLFDTCRSDGGDIRVTLSDGTTQLAREVVSIDTSGKTGELHVNVPSLSGSADTTIRIWYNGTDTEPAIDSTYGQENTWNSNYLLVYHMDDDTSSTVLDSTSNSNDGVKTSADNPLEVTGKIGNAQDFSSDQITVSASATLRDLPTTYDFEVSFWVNSDTVSNNDAAFSWSGTDDLVYYPNDNKSGSGGARVFWRDLGGDILDEAGTSLVGTYYLNHFVSRASNDHEFYRNAVSLGTSTNTGSAGPFTDVFVGQFPGQIFDGPIDEFRIRNSPSSDDWKTAEFNNQSSPTTFYSVSNEQSSLFVLDLNSGSYSILGSSINLQELQINLESGSYGLIGSITNLLHEYTLNIESGNYTITGTFIDFNHQKEITTGWISTKGEGPWEFTEQPNKWGYLNNPRWTSQPTKAINYDGNEEDEPQIWASEGEGNFSSGDSKVHIPCGHWHKVPVESVGSFTADIFTVHQGYYVENERDFITGVRFYNDKLTYIGYYQAATLETNLQALTEFNGDLITIQGVNSNATLINVSSVPYQGQFPFIQEFDTLSDYDITDTSGSTFETVNNKYFLTSQNGRMVRFDDSWTREAYHYYGVVAISPSDGALYVNKYKPVFGGGWAAPPSGGDNSYWHYIPEQSVDGPITPWGEGSVWSIRSLITGIMYYNSELYISQFNTPYAEFQSFNPDTFIRIKWQLNTGGRYIAETNDYLHTTSGSASYSVRQNSKINLSSITNYNFGETVSHMITVNDQLVVSTDSDINLIDPNTYVKLFTLPLGNIRRLLNLNNVYFIGVSRDTIYAFKLHSNTIIQIDSVSINENGLSGYECRGVVSINR